MAQTSQETQLVNLLSELDETLIINALEKAAAKRVEKGLGPDLMQSLKARGIKVQITFSEKPFWKSKKFWGGVIALIILLVSTYVPAAADLWKVSLPALVYIFGQGLADLGKNRPQLPTPTAAG